MPNRHSQVLSRWSATLATLMLSLMLSASSQTLQVLHNFGVTVGDGNVATSPLLKDAAGNFYGMTSQGGTHNMGTVYRLSPTGSGDFKETILHSFKGGSADGAVAIGSLFQDSKGNLYGTTPVGGINATVCDGLGFGDVGCGVVFKLTPTASGEWTETVLHRFKGSDGGVPYSGLVRDSKGNFYGATTVGGSAGLGVVYKLSHTASVWKETVLHSFTGNSDGASPFMNETTLAFDSRGNIYGSTFQGGAADAGVVFELSPPKTSGAWTEKILYTFQGAADGSQPFTGVTLDKSGNLYGGTLRGGTHIGSGTVFKLTAANGYAKTILHDFSLTDPALDLPNTPILDASGNLYGTTEYALFQLSPGSTGWTETVLWNWVQSGDQDGNTLYAPPIMDAQGNFYGTTVWGGQAGPDTGGVAWEVIP